MGYTLTEMLVVIGLLGFVVGGAYALFHLARTGTDMSDKQAWTSREIGQPLEHMERLLSQQVPPLITGDAYVCEIKTDQDRDNHYEYHRFEATADGRLVERVYELVDNPTPRTVVWSQNNTNRATGRRIFTYYDIAGNNLQGQQPLYVQQYAASVVIEVVTDRDGDVYSDSRQVFFRNR